MIIYFIPASVGLYIVMALLAALGIGIQTVFWVVQHIVPISAVIWAIVLMAVYSHSERGERILRVSEAVPFVPFYMGMILVLFKWFFMLNQGGLAGMLNFVLYIIDIPIWGGIYFLPSYLILKASRHFLERHSILRILFNLLASVVYAVILYVRNFETIQVIVLTVLSLS